MTFALRAAVRRALRRRNQNLQILQQRKIYCDRMLVTAQRPAASLKFYRDLRGLDAGTPLCSDLHNVP
jgi:hypothetical protein